MKIEIVWRRTRKVTSSPHAARTFYGIVLQAAAADVTLQPDCAQELQTSSLLGRRMILSRAPDNIKTNFDAHTLAVHSKCLFLLATVTAQNEVGFSSCHAACSVIASRDELQTSAHFPGLAKFNAKEWYIRGQQQQQRAPHIKGAVYFLTELNTRPCFISLPIYYIPPSLLMDPHAGCNNLKLTSIPAIVIYL